MPLWQKKIKSYKEKFMARIQKGSIIQSKFTYGCEIMDYDFYEVVSVSEKGMATLRALQSETRYYSTDGHIYYDTPHDVRPTSLTRTQYSWKTNREEPMPLMKRKIYNYGTDHEYLKPQEYHTAWLWDGKAKEVYNLH